MNNVWYSIVRFFQKLFVPPELTPFERFLVAQVSHLESEINRERELSREREKELLERLLPGNSPRPNVVQETPVEVKPRLTRAQEMQARFEEASKERLKEHWEKHIEDLERRNAELESKSGDKVLLEKKYTPAPEEVI